MLTHDELQAIRARHAAATRGPWKWGGYMSTNYIDLCGADTVMEFRRWGMQNAQPWFCTRGGLDPAHKLAVPDTSPERGRITAIKHPDAQFIASSWADVRDLLSEVDRLRARVAELESRETSLPAP